MRAFATRFALLAAACAAAAACGTEVDVGANGDKARQLASGDGVPQGDEPDRPIGGGGDTGGGNGGGSDSGGGNGGGSGGGGGNGGATLTCFGPAPERGPDLDAFCAIPADDARRQAFARAFALVCDERRLVNLLLTPCSWTGEGAQDPFRRVLQKTALDDQTSTDFDFLASYALTSQSSLEDHAALIYREMNDPAFAERFVTIRNSRVSNIVANADGSYDYSVELASSAAKVSFRARLSSLAVTQSLTVFFDESIGDEVLLKKHRFLRFLHRLDDGRTRVIGVDEKLIADSGNHLLAYRNLMDVLMQRMGRDYENTLRD